MNDYAKLLSHPKWQRKRLEIMESRNMECEWCGDKENTLHVHHKAYISGNKPWEYEDSNFILLCENCHKKLHSEMDAFKQSIASQNPMVIYPLMNAMVSALSDNEDYAIMLSDYADRHFPAFSDGISELVERLAKYDRRICK